MGVNKTIVLVYLFQLVMHFVDARKHVNIGIVNIPQKGIFSVRERGRGVQRDHFPASTTPPRH